MTQEPLPVRDVAVDLSRMEAFETELDRCLQRDDAAFDAMFEPERAEFSASLLTYFSNL